MMDQPFHPCQIMYIVVVDRLIIARVVVDLVEGELTEGILSEPRLQLPFRGNLFE